MHYYEQEVQLLLKMLDSLRLYRKSFNAYIISKRKAYQEYYAISFFDYSNGDLNFLYILHISIFVLPGIPIYKV